MSKLDRAFKISDGLAHLAGKKIKAAVAELKREGIITASESAKILSQMAKVKRSIYDNVTKELKKVIHSAVKQKGGKKKKSKKKKR
jgi:argininosuccinate lyase